MIQFFPNVFKSARHKFGEEEEEEERREYIIFKIFKNK